MNKSKKQPENIEQAKIMLEAAGEHLSQLWHRLKRDGIPFEPIEDPGDVYPERFKKFPVDSAVYSLAAVDHYIYAVWCFADWLTASEELEDPG